MTVKQLKEELSKYPENMDVFIDERYTDFKFGALNTVAKTMVDFMEEPCGEVLSSHECVILSED